MVTWRTVNQAMTLNGTVSRNATCGFSYTLYRRLGSVNSSSVRSHSWLPGSDSNAMNAK
jgi:hypothetical protein